MWLGFGAIALVVVSAAVFIHTQRGKVEGTSVNCPTDTATNCVRTAAQTTAAFDPSHGTCQGKGPVMFGASPFELKKLAYMLPMGSMIGGHVTPIDHGYMFGVGTPNVPPDAFTIHAPARGYVVQMSRTQREGKNNFIDYAMTIEFSCDHYVQYSNMSSFTPRLIQAGGMPALNSPLAVRIPVAEGEIVGRTGPYGIDLYVWDRSVNLTGYIVPKHYGAESWKLHSADFFNYLKEPLKTQLLAKNLRQAQPPFGKIDYDIDGRLVGNWFKVGTYGYGGRPPGQPGGGEYWKGHAAFAPDSFDPNGVVVSLGNWQGEAQQFGVKGNRPDPAKVSVASGPVKYELVQLGWAVAATGQPWDYSSYVKGIQFKPHDDFVKGVLLVQLVSSRQLKVEMFPGKTADEVSGFTKAALMYER